MPHPLRRRAKSPVGRGLRANGKRRPTRLRGVEVLEPRLQLTATPFGALPADTAEFLLGDVYVTVVFIESSERIDSNNDNSETWTQADNGAINSIPEVKRKVEEGLQWWEDTLAGITNKHHLEFHIDFTHADSPFVSDVEPITQESDDTDIVVNEFLRDQLDPSERTGLLSTDVRTFNHNQREANDANWSFIIFVVNDANDADHEFAPGGLRRAFAFPGGLYLVTLASRPASTVTHETGHIFWAYDEYPFSGATYNDSRGYYNTQNLNASTGHPNPSSRVASIMERGACDEGGGLLCDAYQQHTSSPSSLAMLGWQDSDRDGVFDVLDVPHTLTGSGSYDPASGNYRFVGESSVQTLPNLNPRAANLPTESLQSDITINRISRAQFRVDGGTWQTAEVYDSYTASLDLSIPVAATANVIEIRTIDDTTGVSSPVFQGSLARPTSVLHPGINGFVFTDVDRDGEFQSGEPGIAGRLVRLVDSSGQPISLERGVEPDEFAADAELNDAAVGVTLTAVGDNVDEGKVFARSTGSSKVFGVSNGVGIVTSWVANSRELRIDFDSPVTSVSIDAVGTGFSLSDEDFGRLEIYDANNKLLARHTSSGLADGVSETMTLNRATADIAYAIATAHHTSSVQLDNLRFGPQTSAVTDEQGAYAIAYLPGGNYTVEVVVPAGSTPTGDTSEQVTLHAGSGVSSIDFGFSEFVSKWQNTENPVDTNKDGFVSPIDALLIINNLNEKGSRRLTDDDLGPVCFDVNGDGFVAPVDVLRVINANESGSGEGEAGGGDVAAKMEPLDIGPRPDLYGLPTPGLMAAEAESGPDDRPELTAATVESIWSVPAPQSAERAAPAAAEPSDLAIADLRDDLFESLKVDDALSDFAGEIARLWSAS